MTDPLASAGTVHTTREIEALIPHRWPMLMVDRIVEYDAEAHRIVGIKGVTATEFWAQGHGCQFIGMAGMGGDPDVGKLYVRRGYRVAETHYLRAL